MNKDMLKAVGLSSFDMLMMSVLLETTWWALFGLLEVRDMILIDDDKPWHQKCPCLMRFLLAIMTIWYEAITNGKSNFWLWHFLTLSFVLDVGVCLNYFGLINMRFNEKHDASEYEWWFTIIFIMFRVCFYDDIFDLIKNKKTHCFNANKRQSDSLYGTGVMEVAKYYYKNTQKALMITLIWEWLWSFKMFAFQFPKYFFPKYFFPNETLYVDDQTMHVLRFVLAVSAIGSIVQKSSWGLKASVVLQSFVTLSKIYHVINASNIGNVVDLLYLLFFVLYTAGVRFGVCCLAYKYSPRYLARRPRRRHIG